MIRFILLATLLIAALGSCKNTDNCELVLCQFDSCIDGKCECDIDNKAFLTWEVQCPPCATENFSPSVGIRFNEDPSAGVHVAFQFSDTIIKVINSSIRSGEASYETYYLDNPEAVIDSGSVVLTKCEVTEIITVIE